MRLTIEVDMLVDELTGNAFVDQAKVDGRDVGVLIGSMLEETLEDIARGHLAAQRERVRALCRGQEERL